MAWTQRVIPPTANKLPSPVLGAVRASSALTTVLYPLTITRKEKLETLSSVLSSIAGDASSGSQAQPSKPAAPAATPEKTDSPTTRRKIDLNEPKTCKNRGCGKPFKEKDNHDAACNYHPGPPVFHDRKRGVSPQQILISSLYFFVSIKNIFIIFLLLFFSTLVFISRIYIKTRHIYINSIC